MDFKKFKEDFFLYQFENFNFDLKLMKLFNLILDLFCILLVEAFKLSNLDLNKLEPKLEDFRLISNDYYSKNPI